VKTGLNNNREGRLKRELIMNIERADLVT